MGIIPVPDYPFSVDSGGYIGGKKRIKSDLGMSDRLRKHRKDQHTNKLIGSRYKQRTLAKRVQVKRPERFIFFDTETNYAKVTDTRIEHKLMLGCASYVRFYHSKGSMKEEKLRFTTNDEFWSFVFSKSHDKTALHLICHNLNFDTTIVETNKHLKADGWGITFSHDAGHTGMVTWKKGKKTLHLVNNANWFKGTLAKLGETLGIDKLDMPEGEASESDWFTYCERDVEILVKAQKWLMDWLKDNDIGSWQFTIPAIALNSYRYRFMTHPIRIPVEEKEINLARQSYRGGRTEVFKQTEIKDKPLYKFDVNSMYPYVMHNENYPTRLRHLGDCLSLSDLDKLLTKNAVIADVKLNVREPYFPVYNGFKNVYPVGRFQTWLTTPELLIARDYGWIEEINDFAIYDQRPIFTEYVSFFYEQRLQWKAEDQLVPQLLAKLMLNSLYGKFGQRGYDTEILFNSHNYEDGSYPGVSADGSDHWTDLVVGDNVLRMRIDGEGYNSFTAIASHVTAYARVYLYNLVMQAGRENCYYTDTDSLIVNQDGCDRLTDLVHSTRLGAIKLEGTSYHTIICAPKHYQFGEKWIIKGIGSNDVEIEKDTYRQEQWPGRNALINDGSGKYFNKIITKHLSKRVTSGIVVPSGDVVPFNLPDDWELCVRLSQELRQR
jgi:hypothetical protein